MLRFIKFFFSPLTFLFWLMKAAIVAFFGACAAVLAILFGVIGLGLNEKRKFEKMQRRTARRR